MSNKFMSVLGFSYYDDRLDYSRESFIEYTVNINNIKLISVMNKSKDLHIVECAGDTSFYVTGEERVRIENCLDVI